MTALTAAIANLKGGVGKSTTTVMLADGLAFYYGMNVLVIDLDPQANSSQMLLTERGVQAASDQGKGVHHVLGELVLVVGRHGFSRNRAAPLGWSRPATGCEGRSLGTSTAARKW